MFLYKLTLINLSRDILAPVMIRKETTWSNIWGAVNEKGYYLRSEDYLDIIYRSSLYVLKILFPRY